jgi:beta-lactamase superfamily II metal-dependent hydrolase
VVVTVGANEWGYPSKKTMERLSSHCPVVLRTDLSGTVVLECDGSELRVIQPETTQP